MSLDSFLIFTIKVIFTFLTFIYFIYFIKATNSFPLFLSIITITAIYAFVGLIRLPIITIARYLTILTIFSTIFGFAIEANSSRLNIAVAIFFVIVLKSHINVAREVKRYFMYMHQAFAIHPSAIHTSVIHPSAIHPSAIVADDGCPSVYKDNIFTLELMLDPVIASDGFTYERASILRWFAMGKNTSPTTGAVLLNRVLITNNSLRRAIHEHRAAAAINNCDVNN
jgi:hypothetical protein